MRSLNSLRSQVVGDVSENTAFCIGTYSVLGVVALVMTVINIVTNKGFLTVCTAAFSILCFVNVFFTFVGPFAASVAKGMFALEVLFMFTFFLVSGNPEGFSAIWICMLPSTGMFFFNKYRGTALCAAMFLILVFFLWTPYGEGLLMYNYTDSFKMRFPVLFVAFHVLAFFLETLRINAYKEMRRLQNYYQDLSIRDPLTGVFNRQGMYYTLETDEKYRNAKKIGVAMFDVDHFKNVNDMYGHIVGDTVLKEFANLLKSSFDNIVCRWGGEEFIVVFTDDVLKSSDFEKARALIEQQKFTDGDKEFNITASIGVCSLSGVDAKTIDSLIEKADEAMYSAKNDGRNNVVFCVSDD